MTTIYAFWFFISIEWCKRSTIFLFRKNIFEIKCGEKTDQQRSAQEN